MPNDDTNTLLSGNDDTNSATAKSNDGAKPEGEKKPEGEAKPGGSEKKPEGEQKPEGEKKSEGDKKPEGEKKPDGEKKQEGAPEKYEFKPPEGTTLDDAVVGVFSEVAKELNLPQDAAQKVIDKVAPAITAAQVKAAEKLRGEWGEQTKTDKEIGGDKLAENLGAAKKAMEAFATSEFKTLLEVTGLGNHPEVIRAFVKIGKAMSEDRLVSGKPGQGDLPAAQRMYPNMNP